MSSQDEHFMRCALKMAQRALDEDQLPVGAVIVPSNNNDVIAQAGKFNGGNFRLDHAEMLVLREALDSGKYKPEELCIYTTLEPCFMCFGAILNCRVPRVVYAMEDPYGGFAKVFCSKDASVPIRHKHEYPEVVGGVLRESARDLFRAYFQTTKNSFWKEARTNPLLRACMG